MSESEEGVPEDVQEYAEEEEMGAPQQQTINRQQFRAEARHLIDIAAQSGISPDEVQDVLDDLSNGVPYFYEDIQRYAQSQDDEE